jgi:hypothetical protein
VRDSTQRGPGFITRPAETGCQRPHHSIPRKAHRGCHSARCGPTPWRLA